MAAPLPTGTAASGRAAAPLKLPAAALLVLAPAVLRTRGLHSPSQLNWTTPPAACTCRVVVG
jgi:hypothetical protein